LVLTLALGIGPNSAVFSAINPVLLGPLPFPNSDRVVSLRRFRPTLQYFTQDDSGLSGDPRAKLTHAFVASRFLQVWTSHRSSAVTSTPGGRYGGPNAVLISDHYWRRRFAVKLFPTTFPRFTAGSGVAERFRRGCREEHNKRR
jgi:putative ABC transport system permease protein